MQGNYIKTNLKIKKYFQLGLISKIKVIKFYMNMNFL